MKDVSSRTIETVSVRRSVHVATSVARAFEVFTAGMGRWWLPSHKLGKAPFQDVILEPRAGGRWFERAEDGSECNWGKVLVWEPPTRLVLAWQISASWVYEPCLTTEVEVRFVEDGDGTRVDLEHRDLERYGAQMDSIRATFESPAGWSGLLRAFADSAGA